METLLTPEQSDKLNEIRNTLISLYREQQEVTSKLMRTIAELQGLLNAPVFLHQFINQVGGKSYVASPAVPASAPVKPTVVPVKTTQVVEDF